MASNQDTCTLTLKAAGDLSAKQYLFVELSAAQTVDACNATTDKSLGVLQNDPGAAGLPAVVAYAGTTKVIAGGAISAGANVAPTSAGKAQTAVATQYARGVALEAASSDGDIIEILLLPLTVMA